jgi:glycerol kinase
MQYILALDQGTTSSRAILVGHNGEIKASAQKEFPQIFPKPGWVEHDPKDIWSSQASVIGEILADCDISDIAAIGITNQRETTFIWDRKSGQPIYNAIVWQDRRTTEMCRELKNNGLEKSVQEKTGLLLDPYFSATKIHWILNNVADAKKKAEAGQLCFGTADSYLIWKLTNGKSYITDATNASRTMLYNIHTGDWDDELLRIFGVPRSMLPKVCDSSAIIAHAHLPTFSRPIPIAGIAGDQQAALFGQMCLKPGMVKATYGTGSFILMNTGEKPVASQNNLLTTIAYQINGRVTYAMEGSVFIAGAIVQWLRDGLHLIRESAEVEKIASEVPDNGGVYFVPALTGLGAPHWNPHTRGTVFGITRGTTNGHIVRAALEGIAFQVTDVLKAMEKDSGIQIKELRVDGGAVKSDLLMQFQADLLGVALLRPHITELTALGAAFLAGLGCGFWKNIDELSTYWKSEKRFQRKIEVSQAEKLLSEWHKAIKCAQTWEE